MKEDLAFDSVDPNLIRAYGLAPVLVSHYQRMDACVQKVIALAIRRQIQARDVFDLHLLLTSGIDTTVLYDKAAKYIDKAKENI